MNILDSLKDIVKHTHSLGIIDMVKLNGSATELKIEAIDGDKSVVIYGDMKATIPGLGSTVGISRIPILKGFIDNPMFSGSGAAVTIVSEDKGGNATPTEVKFDDGDGLVANYRFMSETMANDQIKVPAFRGANWDVTIVPEKAKIQNLSYFQNVLGGQEKRFTVVINNGTMEFHVGTGPTDRTKVPFSKNVTGALKSQWSWPLTQVLSILKLTDSAKSATMYFSDMGAMKIEIDSGLGKYSYILPASKA